MLLLLLVLVAAGVFFTPRVVSTKWFRHQLETRASEYLHRPVTVRDLKWTWKEGIRIKGFEAAEDPEFGKGPFLSIDGLSLAVDVELDPRRLLVHLTADGLNANVIRQKDGRINLERFLAQLRPPEKTAETTSAPPKAAAPPSSPPSSLVLPGDLDAQITLTNFGLRVEDRMEDRLLEIRDGALHLNMPSLLKSPVDLEMNTRQSMNGKEMPPLSLLVHVDGLVDESGALNLKGATVGMNGELPGLHLVLSGNMAAKGLKGEVKIDLAPLAQVAQPFMPHTLPEVSGEISVRTNAQLQPDETILFDMDLALEGVSAAGGPLKGKEIGPVSMTLLQKGSVSPAKKEIELDGASIQLMKKSGLSYGGRLKLQDQNRLNVDLAVEKVFVDVDEMKTMAKGLFPDVAPGADLRIDKVRLQGILPDGSANLVTENMVANIPELHLALREDRLRAQKVTLSLPRTAVLLKNQFPQDLETHMHLTANDVRLSGNRPLSLKECQISSLDVAIHDLARSPEALWGLTGHVTLKESGFFRGVILSDKNDGTEHLSHRFLAEIDLPPTKKARVNLLETDIVMAPLKMAEILPKPLKSGLTLKGRLKDVLLHQLKPVLVDASHLEGEVLSGDALKLKVQMAAFDSGRSSFETEGVLKVDLRETMGLIPSKWKPKGRFSGGLETRWHLKGRRPTDAETKMITDSTLSLDKRLLKGGFLEKMDLEARFSDLAVTLPLGSGEMLAAKGIHSEKPFSIHIAEGLKSFSTKGSVKVGEINRLPSLGKLTKPLAIDLSFDAASRDLNTLELRESLNVKPMALQQTLEVRLNKLNRLLKRREKPELSALLKMLEARIKAGVAVKSVSHLKALTKGAAKEVALEGPLRGDLLLELRGGKSVALALNLESPGVNVAIPEKFSISGLKTHLAFHKSYGLLFGPLKKETPRPAKALSLSVLEPQQPMPSRHIRNPLSGRLLKDLRGRLSQKPTLSFEKARFMKGPFPIGVSNAEVQMRLGPSLPSVDYFQMDMMGGTFLGAMGVFKNEGLYRLKMDGAFSGLDAKKLLSGGSSGNPINAGDTKEDTQISGRMSLQVPITAHAGTIMGNLDVVFRLTHIGARTLERFLYAMDPHENNESIVQQRALLKKGTPLWIEVIVKNGNLSLAGEVSVAGTRIRLPAVKRLNMASLPISNQIQKLSGRLLPLLEGLKVLSASQLLVEPGGAIDFMEDGK